MIEERFQYDTGQEPIRLRLAERGSDDFRLLILDDLEMLELDTDLVAVFQSWQELRGSWVEAKVAFDAVRQKLAERETEVREVTPPEAYKAGSAGERKAKFDAIVVADAEVREIQAQVLTRKWNCDNISASIEDAEREMSHIQVRLNWRTFVVRFLSSVQPVSAQEMAL